MRDPLRVAWILQPLLEPPAQSQALHHVPQNDCARLRGQPLWAGLDSNRTVEFGPEQCKVFTHDAPLPVFGVCVATSSIPRESRGVSLFQRTRKRKPRKNLPRASTLQRLDASKDEGHRLRLQLRLWMNKVG